MISLVIAACRTLFMYSVRLSIISVEFRVAASIAVICAAKNAAFDSRAPAHLCLHVTWQQVVENLFWPRLVQIVGSLLTRVELSPRNREQSLNHDALRDHRFELVIDESTLDARPEANSSIATLPISTA